MKSIYVVAASQEYDVANHQGFWQSLAKKSNNIVVVVNIPADYLITILRGKRERIADAKRPAKTITNNLYVVRPLMYIRPELCTKFGRQILAKQFWKAVEKAVPDFEKCIVNLIVYNAFWVKILKGSHPHLRIGYYLFDEVRSEGNSNKRNKRRYKDDDYACSNCNLLFTMTQVLADSRLSYCKPTLVIGNGSTVQNPSCSQLKLPNSIAFIGNIRNWIDKSLLEGIIQRMPDCLFSFIGPVEADMRPYLNDLLNHYSNTMYKGIVSKDRISDTYRLFDVVIIPYLQNEFIKATRPIKIVESIMSGTPVVTIPMNGYNQSEFIRFGTSVDSFEKEIRFLIKHPIDKNSQQYRSFVENNSWDKKAETVIDAFHSIGKY